MIGVDFNRNQTLLILMLSAVKVRDSYTSVRPLFNPCCSLYDDVGKDIFPEFIQKKPLPTECVYTFNALVL